MRDITTMKLKTDLGLKKLNFPKLKEVKVSSSLPRNTKLDNIFNIAKGRSNSKGMMNTLRPTGMGGGMRMLSQRNKSFNINSIMPRKGMKGIVPRNGMRGILPRKGEKGIFKILPYQGVNDVYKPFLTKKTGRFNINKKSPLGSIEGLGKRRIDQQKGLKPLGDFDGDSLINMLDCHPRNKFLQGPEHTIEDKLEPENLDEIEEEPMEEPMAEEEPMKQEDPIFEEPQSTSKAEEFAEQRRLKNEAKQDDIEEKRRRLAFDKQLFSEQRRADRIDRLIKSKEAKLREAERKEKEQKKKQPTKGQKALKEVDKFFKPLSSGISTISSASKGFGGFGVSQQKIVGATGLNSLQYKILSALGKAPPLPAQQPVQPQQPQQTTVQQAQSNPQQGIQSPYSGRKVSYVRGPYNKGAQQ